MKTGIFAAATLTLSLISVVPASAETGPGSGDLLTPPAATAVRDNPFSAAPETELYDNLALKLNANKMHESLIKVIEANLERQGEKIKAQKELLATASSSDERERISSDIETSRHSMEEWSRDREDNIAAIEQNNREMDLIRQSLRQYVAGVPR